MSDAFEQLRVSDDPGAPDPRFVAGLRNRLVIALDAAGLPTIDRPPPRRTTMTDTATRPRTTSTITPYLSVTPAVEAIGWYVDVLGAVEHVRYTGDDGRVGHAELTIGGARFMLSDAYPELGVQSPTALGGTPFSMHLEVPDVDAVHARVVADGRGRVGRPPHDEAYGARSFDVVDPFGHRWMIQTPIGDPTLDEVQAQTEGFTITAPTPEASAAEPAVEIGYLTFATPDTAVAARFYGALFGWAFEGGGHGDEYAHVANTRLPMGITPGRADEAPVPYFRVADLDAMAARVRELGGTVVEQETSASGPNATCRDDQGHEFRLWQPAPGYA